MLRRAYGSQLDLSGKQDAHASFGSLETRGCTQAKVCGLDQNKYNKQNKQECGAALRHLQTQPWGQHSVRLGSSQGVTRRPTSATSPDQSTH